MTKGNRFCRRLGCGHSEVWHEHYTTSTHCGLRGCACEAFQTTISRFLDRLLIKKRGTK